MVQMPFLSRSKVSVTFGLRGKNSGEEAGRGSQAPCTAICQDRRLWSMVGEVDNRLPADMNRQFFGVQSRRLIQVR